MRRPPGGGLATTPGQPQRPEIATAGATPPGREQTTFNRLVRQLEGLRRSLAEWNTFEARHRQRVATGLLPLQEQIVAARRELILLLDALLEGRAAGTRPAGKAEHRQLLALLLDLLGHQLADDPGDREIIAIHDRHADTTFAEEQELERELTRDFAEQVLGVELEDAVLDGSPDDILAEGLERARLAEEEWIAQQQAHRDHRERARAGRKAAAAEQAALEAGQSLRTVYRKLASALHPDRAADAVDSARRHELMQRVNNAYEAKDLLSLLSLQLEIEQIDAGHLARASKERIAHYNTVLREQVRELEQELRQLTDDYRDLLDDPGGRITPARIERALQEDIGFARGAIADLRELRAIMQQPALRREWLRDYARVRRAEERADARLFARMQAEMDDADEDDYDPFEPVAPRRRRGRKSRR